MSECEVTYVVPKHPWHVNQYGLVVCHYCECVMKRGIPCKCKGSKRYLHKQGNRIARDLLKFPDEDYFGFRPGKHYYRRLGIKEQL